MVGVRGSQSAVKQGDAFQTEESRLQRPPNRKNTSTAYSTGHCLWAGLSVEGILRPDWWLNPIISRKFCLKDKTESGVVKGAVCGNATVGADWDKVFEHLYHLLGESGLKQMLGGTCFVQIWRSGDSFWKSALSFHHLGPRDQTQVLRLGNCILPTKPFCWPKKI